MTLFHVYIIIIIYVLYIIILYFYIIKQMLKSVFLHVLQTLNFFYITTDIKSLHIIDFHWFKLERIRWRQVSFFYLNLQLIKSEENIIRMASLKNKDIHIERDIIIEKQTAQYFVYYSECLSNSLLFLAPKIIKII